MLPLWYHLVYGALIGACIGSFCGVVIERTRDNISLNGRSRCICGRQLRARENLPIIGWLLGRGRARCCGARIPSWYLYIEILAMLLLLTAAGIYKTTGLIIGALALIVVSFVIGRVGRRGRHWQA